MDLPGYSDFIRTVARQSYGSGQIRFLLPGTEPSLIRWNEPSGWREDWPLWASRLRVFAYDWLGRQIAFDLNRSIDGGPAISILEPGTGKVLETPEGFAGFLNRELVEYADAALATSFFETWRKSGGAAPKPAQCVGYKTPLFMGGADEIGNLEISDLSVYISMCGQLYEQVRKLPPGTRIGGVRREK